MGYKTFNVESRKFHKTPLGSMLQQKYYKASVIILTKVEC